MPAAIAGSWRAAHRRAAITALAQCADLARTAGLLEAAGFAPIALKGAWLAHHAYPEPAQRPMRDLDLLVREHGTQLRSFPEEVVTRMAEAAYDVRAASGKDGVEKRIYESFARSLKLMRGWAGVSDGPYYAARALGK